MSVCLSICFLSPSIPLLLPPPPPPPPPPLSLSLTLTEPIAVSGIGAQFLFVCFLLCFVFVLVCLFVLFFTFCRLQAWNVCTFDKRLTWRQQTEKAEARAKVRLALMKKLAGTTWGADTVTLKRLYTGRVRPVLEYGMTAWGTTAKSNFDRVSKVQNQATRIITWAMKSTPIMELETITGLQSLDDRRDLKLLSQAATFKRLQDHPMRQRLSLPTKGRLKRESFVHQSRMLERRQEDILDHDPKEIPPPPPPPLHVLRFLPGVGELPLSFGVPSQVLVRKTPKAALRESPSLRNTLKLTTQKSPGPSGTLMALLRMQFGMEGQESTSSTQEAKKTKLASLPAYTPQTTKLKQKP